MTTIGIVGLGNIGLPLARNLLNAGHHVLGVDTMAKADFVTWGGEQVASVGGLASCDVIVQSLPNAAALEQSIAAIEMFGRPGLTVVDLSSYALDAKVAAAERLGRRGVVLLDCEVSGLPHQVAERTAVIFKSGDADAIDACRPIFDAITDRHFYLGEFGAATKMKLVANLMVCVHDLMAAEALNLGARVGLDPAQMIEVLTPSAAGSATFANKAPLMVSRAFDAGRGPFRHMFGYLGRIDALARNAGVATPLLDVTRTIFSRAEDEGRHDQDIAAVIEIVEGLGSSGK